MREIKFRAIFQRTPNSREPEGDFCVMHYGTGFSRYGLVYPMGWRLLAKDLQYTGLKDRNKVEIYEGDILDINGVRFLVTWSDRGWFPFSDRNDNGEWEWDADMFIVIGNIYENPELMEEK